MDVRQTITRLRNSSQAEWPADSLDQTFAASLDKHPDLVHFRDEFVIPSKSELTRKTLTDDKTTTSESNDSSDPGIYFCGNSLGLQPKLTSKYIESYLKTWRTIGVAGHFRPLEDSPLSPYLDMAAECSRKSADLFGAAPEEIVIMNSLTVNLHLMMTAFYKPSGRKNKIMLEWKPFPSDFYAIESQILWHGHDPTESMLLVSPEAGSHLLTTPQLCGLIDAHADELALILLPGIQYYSGQLLDIPTVTAHAHSRGVTIGWDLAHAAGNVELRLHDWKVDFACWCTYKYMNAGAGAIAGCFVHADHGDVTGRGGLRGWYGGDMSVRFNMENKFVPTPGAQGFQISNPSVLDLTSLSASLTVFNKTSIAALRDKSLLLTAYVEHLLLAVRDRRGRDLFNIITPSDPMQRGAQLSLLLREDLMEDLITTFEESAIVCDKRKPGVIRVSPAPLYNTFTEVWTFVKAFEKAIAKHADSEKPNGMGVHAQ